jgi:hypothetical protein
VTEKKDLPVLSPSLFWDCDTTKLDFTADRQFILARVFSRGLESDEREVCRYYGIDEIKATVVNISYLDKKALNYLSLMMGIPEKEFKCYKKTRSAKNFGRLYHAPLLEDVHEEDGIRFLGKRDLAAMKLEAIANNGTRAKDFVDIFFLLKSIALNDMLADFKKKYGVRDICYVKRSLVYFDDIEESGWRLINYLHENVPAKTVKRIIVEAVNKYNADKKLLNKNKMGDDI